MSPRAVRPRRVGPPAPQDRAPPRREGRGRRTPRRRRTGESPSTSPTGRGRRPTRPAGRARRPGTPAPFRRAADAGRKPSFASAHTTRAPERTRPFAQPNVETRMRRGHRRRRPRRAGGARRRPCRRGPPERAATPSTPRTFRYPTFVRTYRPATSAQPARSATGNVRPGSFTSAPGERHVRPRRLRERRPDEREDERGEEERRSFGRRETLAVRRGGGGRGAEAAEACHARGERPATFTAVRMFCSARPRLQPAAFVAVRTRTTSAAAPFAVHPFNGRSEDAEELRERDGDGGDRARLDDERHRPAVEEPRHRP